ncbi:MFS transporter [Streptomyces sp. NPDC101150]|uniref:MFS transporter n=1 Tax=Streptomyces sp. NPDC101150 TaxID=3366114 RepID=UPI00380CABFC
MPATATSHPHTPPALPTAPARPEQDHPRTAAGQVPVFWLALLATPIAAGANAPVLILPDMARSLGVGAATASWLVMAFAWAMAVGTPLVAGLLRRRGLRAALRLSGALVLAGTVLVTLSPWLPLALAGRAAQAAGGAGLVTSAMSLAGSARRMGVISAGFGMLGASGPLLGEWLTGILSWRAALAVSAISLLAVAKVGRYAREVPPAEDRFDARGAALLTAFATALVLLPTAPAYATAPAVIAGALLTWHVSRRPEGFVPLKLLRTPAFRTSALLALAASTSYFTLLFAVPQLLADRAGWSKGDVGTGQLVALLVGAALSWFFAAASSRIGRGAVRVVLVALGVAAAGTAAATSWGPLLLVAMGTAVFTATGSNAVLSVHAATSAPEQARATAIGLFTLCYQLGGAFGPAIATALVLS